VEVTACLWMCLSSVTPIPMGGGCWLGRLLTWTGAGDS
jgi:hypothetical protein